MKAFISGCQGYSLTPDELQFFADECPWGLILFQRNCESKAQISDLVQAFRSAVGRSDAPVLIDQEGGRVQRLKPPVWRLYPSGSVYASLYERDFEAGLRCAWLGTRLIADDLYELGINVDCLPVLDVPVSGADPIIGDRAYGLEPEQIIRLAGAAIDGLRAGGVSPVIKHIPGHGRANVDSHLALPRVSTDRATLDERDFAPFRAFADEALAMTAHVVFEAIDPDAPATTSSRLVQDVMRQDIGFSGAIMSDDLSMKALSGTMVERTEAVFQAGCDLALHCNGDFRDMKDVAKASPHLDGVALERCSSATARLVRPEPLDRAAAEAEFDELLGRVV